MSVIFNAECCELKEKQKNIKKEIETICKELVILSGVIASISKDDVGRIFRLSWFFHKKKKKKKKEKNDARLSSYTSVSEFNFSSYLTAISSSCTIFFFSTTAFERPPSTRVDTSRSRGSHIRFTEIQLTLSTSVR